jgi:hypothetical protein
MSASRRATPARCARSFAAAHVVLSVGRGSLPQAVSALKDDLREKAKAAGLLPASGRIVRPDGTSWKA